MDNKFSDGSLYDNINKFANSLGYKNAGVALTLAMVPWRDTQDRDAFIQAITGKPVQGDNAAEGV